MAQRSPRAASCFITTGPTETSIWEWTNPFASADLAPTWFKSSNALATRLAPSLPPAATPETLPPAKRCSALASSPSGTFSSARSPMASSCQNRPSGTTCTSEDPNATRPTGNFKRIPIVPRLLNHDIQRGGAFGHRVDDAGGRFALVFFGEQIFGGRDGEVVGRENHLLLLLHRHH